MADQQRDDDRDWIRARYLAMFGPYGDENHCARIIDGQPCEKPHGHADPCGPQPADPRIVTRTATGRLVKHGGAGTGYTLHGCRCDECTEAHAARQRRRRAERHREEPTVHGASAYRSNGCRCPICTAANAEACRAYP